MAVRTLNIIARLLWLAPALLLFLTAHQALTAYQLRDTWEHGEEAVAEVVDYDYADRADITYGYLHVRVEMPDGSVIEKERMSLPSTLVTRVQGREQLEVRVQPDAPQPIVIAHLMPGHWLIAAVQSVIAFFGALMLGAGIFWWNRYLAREGDPAQRLPGEEETHPSEKTSAR